jgi:hypothetical protein
MGHEVVDALAREIADLKAVEPGVSATAEQWAAWYLRQANVLDEIASADPSQAESARRQAGLVRDQARAVLRQEGR